MQVYLSFVTLPLYYFQNYTCLHVCVTVNNSPCCPPAANRQIRDLFEDLRDGHNLISLLEVLTGEQLPRERGQMRFHMLHNIDTALHFLHCKKIKLVNIRSEDIVDGNPKLTLGLIWTIILHFQVSTLPDQLHIETITFIVLVGVSFSIYIISYTSVEWYIPKSKRDELN
ncbi:hypothetical protein WA026_023053 [Henosepilachna vigintioctopunctata]|uniref:Calponin-homology (CH) domain-containing protein n=1 Tax=Henosepilachna vigintioctopunctata TaxID=420089 RepID=A0AAW1UVJ9_9CUCU